MHTYDLIIKYTDGDSQIVKDVSNHSYEPERGMFVFKKNGFRFFIPKENVKAFGRAVDYTNSL